MSGNRFLLDTNAVIELLRGNDKLNLLIRKSSWLGMSVISEIEFLVFPKINNKDMKLFNLFCDRIEIIDLESSNKILLNTILGVRKKYKLKLPDAIIVSTAIINNAKLISRDKDFSSIKEIEKIFPE
ncbi:type II toxin-antitoxin system VapC family toxin [Candidatus Margulisiibacteriota bacterium]